MRSGFVRFLRGLSHQHAGFAQERVLRNRFRPALESLEERVVPAVASHSLSAAPALIQFHQPPLQQNAMVGAAPHVAQAKAVAATISPFAGAYTGTFAGAAINGNIAFTVASNGKISLTQPGKGTGSVSPTGAIQLTAPAGGGVTDKFSATLVISGGNVGLGATTSFQAIKNTRVIDTGSWSLTQAPTSLPLDTVTAVGPTGTSLLETPTFSWNAVSNGNLAGYVLTVVDVTNAKKSVTIFSTVVDSTATSFVSPTAFLTLGHNYAWSIAAFDNASDPSPVTTTTFQVISPLAGTYGGADEETAHDIDLPELSFVINANGSISVKSPGNGKGTGSVDILGNATFTAVGVGKVGTLHLGNAVYTNNISVSSGQAGETGGQVGTLKLSLLPRGTDSGIWNLSLATLTGTPLDTPTMTSISPLNPNNSQATASLTPTFSWAPVNGADYYVLSVDNLTTKQNHVILATAIPSGTTTFTVSADTPLVASDRYQWEVQAVTNGGNASTWGGGATFFADVPTPAITNVFYIDLENHNFTEPDSEDRPQIMGDTAAAPFLNGLISADPTTISAISTQIGTQASYATNYYNVNYNTRAPVHPSEPNYVWQESGMHGPLNDNDPFPSNIVNAPNLSALLQSSGAGLNWTSYQEDIGMGPNKAGAVPLKSYIGSSPSYTNPYNGSHQYAFAAKHDGQLFFKATNAPGEASQYEPLTQLATDLQNGKRADGDPIAQYNLITPDLFNDMHTALDTAKTIANSTFTYNGNTWKTGTPAQQLAQEMIAQGDNFLSQVVPLITNSALWAQGHSMIVISFDETEGGSSTQFTIPEIVISPLANGTASGTVYTHSSDLRTMQEIFGVFAANGGFLGGANVPGTNDILDMLHS